MSSESAGRGHRAFQVRTTLADYRAGSSSILKTQVEGLGGINVLSPAPMRHKQIAAAPVSAPPTSPPGPQTYPQYQNKPQPREQKNQQPKSRSPFENPRPKREVCAGRVLHGALLKGLNKLLIVIAPLLLPFLNLLLLFCGRPPTPPQQPPSSPQKRSPPHPQKKAPKSGTFAPPSPNNPKGKNAKGYHTTKAKPRAQHKGGTGCKYKLEGNIYVVFCDKGVREMGNGKEALAAGGPPPKGGDKGQVPGG